MNPRSIRFTLNRICPPAKWSLYGAYRNYSQALDQPVPMLGDRTPRALARTKAGRVKVAEWLKYLENGSVKSRAADDPMASFDFTWMWQELGVADLRQ